MSFAFLCVYLLTCKPFRKSQDSAPIRTLSPSIYLLRSFSLSPNFLSLYISFNPNTTLPIVFRSRTNLWVCHRASYEPKTVVNTTEFRPNRLARSAPPFLGHPIVMSPPIWKPPIENCVCNDWRKTSSDSTNVRSERTSLVFFCSHLSPLFYFDKCVCVLGIIPTDKCHFCFAAFSFLFSPVTYNFCLI